MRLPGVVVLGLDVIAHGLQVHTGKGVVHAVRPGTVRLYLRDRNAVGERSRAQRGQRLSEDDAFQHGCGAGIGERVATYRHDVVQVHVKDAAAVEERAFAYRLHRIRDGYAVEGRAESEAVRRDRLYGLPELDTGDVVAPVERGVADDPYTVREVDLGEGLAGASSEGSGADVQQRVRVRHA